jgi:hypothetical protein
MTGLPSPSFSGPAPTIWASKSAIVAAAWSCEAGALASSSSVWAFVPPAESENDMPASVGPVVAARSGVGRLSAPTRAEHVANSVILARRSAIGRSWQSRQTSTDFRVGSSRFGSATRFTMSVSPSCLGLPQMSHFSSYDLCTWRVAAGQLTGSGVVSGRGRQSRTRRTAMPSSLPARRAGSCHRRT